MDVKRSRKLKNRFRKTWLETINKIWQEKPHLHIICLKFSFRFVRQEGDQLQTYLVQLQ